jgi:excisionase family DNA binding protein
MRLTVDEVAIRLNCSVRHVWRLIKQRKLVRFRDNGLTRVPEPALRDYIQQHVSS